MSVNRAIFSGHLGQDPELRYTPQGTTVCNLRVAISEVRGGGEGRDKTKHTHWINVTAWEKQAESCASILKKGAHVLVDGRLNYRTWQADDGGNRSALEVTADRVEFLDPPPARDEAPPRHGAGEGPGQQRAPARPAPTGARF